jgi:hypothetical protein
MTTDGARHSDPRGSHEAVAIINADTGLHDAIIRQSRLWMIDVLGKGGLVEQADWTDGDMRDALERKLGRRLERGTIARARGRVERMTPAPIVRIGEAVIDGRHYQLFRSTEEGMKP